AGTHPDFFLIQPEEEAKLIKIDQIRALIGSLSQTSHSGKFKIVIIEPAEAMNIASSNALLKTLEEPTDNTLILLVTHQVSLLPATVRSRCQKITFNDTESLGMEDSKFPPPVLGGRARVGGTVEPDQEKFIHDLIQVLSKKLDPIMMASQYIKVEMENWLQWLIIFVINIIHSKMNLSASIYELDLKKLNLAQLFFYLDKLYLAHRNQQLHMNPNKQLLLETLLSSLEATYDC
ncbi:MAG: hypothetical protein JSS53_05200, partial [Proteobacteria bacterium]|nr:hypothetical protein [Pseudomonadota bacterium]